MTPSYFPDEKSFIIFLCYSLKNQSLQFFTDSVKNLAKELKLENLNGVIQSFIRVFEQLVSTFFILFILL